MAAPPDRLLINHELSTLWEHFDQVVDAITDPDSLAEEACKVGLLHVESKRILQSFPADAKTKARSLLQSIEGKIKDQPVYFQYFLALLKKLSGLASLGIIIQKTYDEKVTACMDGESIVQPGEKPDGVLNGPTVNLTTDTTSCVSKDEACARTTDNGRSAVTIQEEDNKRSGDNSIAEHVKGNVGDGLHQH